ncbi:MAG: hypothetical protein A2X86_21230 [Bdellovibrionales bacterium GWA2_49_15]|nr:MAG: hypothetical protein A2X86_21230 [Bdellovibrionales bacterium GWA2_49_15]HAZ14902.1 hypothetical protein [Bdellovibrionales bacterium]
MSFISRRILGLVIVSALLTQGTAFARNDGGGNGNSGNQSSTPSGNNSSNNDDHGNSHYGEGNNGNGVGNTGTGNQGNDKPVGNAGGDHDSDDNGNGNGNDNENGHHGDGNNGNGVGNTGTGNQGNDKPVGNAGGDHGSGTPGTDNPGSGTQGSGDPGTDNPGSGTQGSGDPGNQGSGDQGSGNQGSGTQGSGDQGSGSGAQSSESNRGKFKFKFVPLLFGDVDSITRIYNMSGMESTLFKDTSDSDTQGLVELDNYLNGFKVVKQIDYNLGVGVAGVLTHTYLPGIGASIGIAPYGGSKMVYTNYASDESALKDLKRRMPFKASEALELKVGESVLLDQKGGLFIGAGISAYGLGIGGKVIIEGHFKTYVERMTDEKVLASIFTDKVVGASVYTSAGILGLSQNRVRELSEGFNYIIDLSDETGRSAYEALVKGNLTQAEKVADLSPLRAVKRTETLQRKLVGNSRRLTLGIPFINLSVGEGLFLEHSYRVNHVDGLYTDMEYGIFQKSSSSRLITRHKSVSQVFVGGTAETKDQTLAVVSKLTEGKFSWKYDDDHGTSKKFNRYLRNLRGRTGLEEFLNVQIADKEKLGYTEINFNVTYPDLYVRYLLSQGRSDEFANNIQIRAHELMVEYFKDQVDQDRICPWNVGNDSLSAIGTKICVKTFAKQIAKKTAQLSALIVATRGKQKDGKKFAKSLANLGELIWSNPFLFRSLVEQGRKCGLSAELVMTGKRISYLKRELVSNSDSTCSVR